MESLTEPKVINEKTEFIMDIKHEVIDPDAKYALVKDVEKEENNGESWDSCGGIKSEVVDLKSEDEEYRLIKFAPENLEEETKTKVTNTEAAVEGDTGADRAKVNKCTHCDYSTNRLTDLKRHLQRHKTIQDFQCAQCSYKTSCKHYLRRHVLSHKNDDQVTTYKCTDCGHQTKRLSNLKRHLKRHKTIKDFHCDQCSYQTTRKDILIKHVLCHEKPDKKADQIAPYKCTECDYKTKRLDHIKRHLNRHKMADELNLKRHLTRHTSGAGPTSGTLSTAQFLLEGEDMEKEETHGESLDSSGCIKSEEVDLKSEDEIASSINFGAEKLEGGTKFAKHVTGDRGADNVNVHKCTHCDYSSKHLNNFRRHLDRHKTVQDFQCAQCSYQTRSKEYLKKHVFFHRDADQIPTYKCNDCNFQTKRADSLKQHLKQHKTVDELIIYKCHECDYQTLRIHNLNRHGKQHTSGADHTNAAGRVKLKKHKCVECDYATDRPFCLKRHLKRHASGAVLGCT